jgi:hypothetical protein
MGPGMSRFQVISAFLRELLEAVFFTVVPQHEENKALTDFDRVAAAKFGCG